MDRMSVLVAALQAAGVTVLRYNPQSVQAKIKSTAGDFVTEADIASENTILQTIESTFPEDIVISEETNKDQDLLREDNLKSLTAWVVDPIDGTNNFKRGLTYSAISIGYVENGELMLGGILDPYHNNLYLARKGGGATCNNLQIHVSDKEALDSATRVCTSNSYEGGTQANLDRYQKLGHVWVDVLGSGVMVMADVASGKLDLYHHNALKPWDNAAGFLITAEAGAKITGLKGQPVTWLTSEVVIGNPALVDEFLAKTNA